MEFTEKYMIREAAKQVGVETHVLRYWEKELCLSIPKNEMGHRYYTGREIAFLRQIKYLKDQGFHLKSIRMLGEKLTSVTKLDMGRLHSLRDRLNGELSAEAEPYTEGHAADIPTMISTKMPSKTSDALSKSMPENMPKAASASSISADTSKGMATNTLRNAPAGTLANQQAARVQKKSVSGKTPAVVKGVPTGVSAGVSTGKTVGQKVASVTTGGTISDRTPEEEALLRDLFGDLEEEKEERKEEKKKEEKSTLLELELAEPEKKEESAEKGRAFGVVQGGRSGSLTETAFMGNVRETQAHEEEDGRMEQFRRIMSDIIGEALRENNRELAKSVGENVSDKVIKEMDFMLRTQQEEEEERYRKLDEAIRSCQRSRQETAVAQEGERRKLFGKRKI